MQVEFTFIKAEGFLSNSPKIYPYFDTWEKYYNFKNTYHNKLGQIKLKWMKEQIVGLILLHIPIA